MALTPSLDVALYCHSTLLLYLRPYMLACAARCLHLTPRSQVLRRPDELDFPVCVDYRRKACRRPPEEEGTVAPWRMVRGTVLNIPVFFLCRGVSLIPYAAVVDFCGCRCRVVSVIYRDVELQKFLQYFCPH